MFIKVAFFLVCFLVFSYLAYFLYPLLENLFLRWQKKKIDKITPKLDRMFLDVPLKKLMFIDVVTPFISGIAGYFLTRNLIFTLIFAGAGFLIPLFVVKKLEEKRRKKFAAQLVDGLMILSSSLKAGLSMLQSFEALVEEMPPPISQEFSLVVRQMQMGVSLEAAMGALKKRMRVDELDMVVSAIMVARETGGNLTEIFLQVANTIQERNKLVGRVNALCVQGKLQGIIMSVLPIIFGIFVYKVDAHFFDIFLQDSMGRFLLGYAVVSQILGMFFIRKFSKIDI